MGFGKGFGAFDEDSNHDSKIEKQKLVPIAGIEPSIILSWEEKIIQWKSLKEKFLYLNLII